MFGWSIPFLFMKLYTASMTGIFTKTSPGACPGFLKGGGSNISWFPKKKVIRF